MEGQNLQSKDQFRLRLYKISKTLCLVLARMSMGMYLEVAGPSLPDLKLRTGTDYEEVSRALIARSAGYFIGSLGGGFLRDYFYRKTDLLIAGALLVASIGTVVAPWCKVLALLGFMLHLQGIGEGILDTAGDSIVIQLWGRNAPMPVHSLHFAFGVGALLAPLLARHFLAPDDVIKTSTGNATNGLSGNFTNGSALLQYDIPSGNDTSSSYNPWVDSEIQWAWLIIACFVFTMGVVFACFFLHSLISGLPKGIHFTDTPPSWRVITPHACAKPGSNWIFSTIMMILMFVFYILIVGGERVFSKFIFSFAVESELKFSRQDAAVLNTVFWICFTCGRFLSMLTAACVAPYIMLPVEAIVNLILAILMVSFGTTNRTALWVLTGAFGAFLAPIFPTGVAWASRILNITGMAMAVFFTGAATGGFIFQWLTGALFEYHGPTSMMYVVLAYAIILCCLVAVLQVVGHFFGPRSDEQDECGQNEQCESTKEGNEMEMK